MLKLLTVMLLLSPMSALAVQQVFPKVSLLPSSSTSQLSQPNETVELPFVVSEWLELYKAGKYQDSFDYLLDNMSAGSDEQTKDTKFLDLTKNIKFFDLMRSLLGEIETSLINTVGKYKGYKVIKVVQENKDATNVYLEMLHEKGSIYTSFNLSRTKKGWEVIKFKISPDIEDIFQSD